jgi:hypothetical protein
LKSEIQILEKKHQVLVMALTKELQQLGVEGISDLIYSRYGLAYMEVKVNKGQLISKKPMNNQGKMAVSLLLVKTSDDKV